MKALIRIYSNAFGLSSVDLISYRGEPMTDNEYRRLYDESPVAAQNALFNEYLKYVYSIVYNKLRSCGTQEDIEECVSDIFSAVFLGYDNSKNRNGDLKGFIGAVAVNKAINMYHSLSSARSKVTPLEELDTDIADDNSLTEQAERTELQNIMLRCIKSLGEPESTMIIQKYYYDMKSNEIAKKLSMSPGTVRVKCSRALKKLKALLSAEGLDLKEGQI